MKKEIQSNTTHSNIKTKTMIKKKQTKEINDYLNDSLQAIFNGDTNDKLKLLNNLIEVTDNVEKLEVQENRNQKLKQLGI